MVGMQPHIRMGIFEKSDAFRTDLNITDMPFTVCNHHIGGGTRTRVEIDGHVDTVLSRGKLLIADGDYHGSRGDGRYLTRGLSSYLV